MAFNPAHGLSAQEYQRNVHTYGLNVLPEITPPATWAIFLRQFQSPLIYLLLLAGAITAVLGDFVEAIGIILVVIVNSTLGYFQEAKAEATLADLRNPPHPQARVLRQGTTSEINTTDITVGDIVILRLGDKIPADGILLSGTDITVNEASLTGEALPVIKQAVSRQTISTIKSNGYFDDRKHKELTPENHLYMGTALVTGYGTMLVTRVGTKTEFGQIAASIFNEPEPFTPLQTQLRNFSRIILVIVLLVAAGILSWGLWKGLDSEQLFKVAVAVAVSAIPEGLVIALTVILTLGMRRILQRNALVRKLVAAETLGSVDTICIDKTGTLTIGVMSVAETYFIDTDLAKRSLMATNQQVNALEASLHTWLKNRITAQEEARFHEEEYLERKIFDSESKYSATLGSEYLHVVGAPEIILAHSTLSPADKERIQAQVTDFSSRGLRLVAVAHQRTDSIKLDSLAKLPSNLQWNGLVVLEDPVRANLGAVFAQADTAGITIKVITGDYGTTARAVLERIGIGVPEAATLSGADLAKLNDAQLRARIAQVQLFYRTTPSQKLRIVKALQADQHVVAMMGDGINDTPALKQADIGIVVDNAAEFAKEIADIVLLDSNFATIIAAVSEGRTIFENMRKVLIFLLVDAFQALSLVVLSLLFGLPLPLLPLQIIFLNFVTDSLPDLSLSFEKPSSSVMQDRPRGRHTPLISSEITLFILAVGAIVTILPFILYVFLINSGTNLDTARTMVFALSGIDSMVFIYAVRSFRQNLWEYNPFSNTVLTLATVLGIASIVTAIYWPPLSQILNLTPISGNAWGLIGMLSLVELLVIEVIKLVRLQLRPALANG